MIATSNPHKVKEFQNIFKQFSLAVSGLPKNQKIPLPIENGGSFSENADIKAIHYSCLFPDHWILADDSGLCVDILHGAPGIHSSRFSGITGSSEKNNSKLLSMMASYSSLSLRSARFVCCLSLAKNGQIVKRTKGEVHGKILLEAAGEKGFGYDPLFYYSPFKKTFSQLDEREKNKISHRFRAVRKMADFISCFKRKKDTS